ncbi:hypothetical protein FOB58_001143 [Candida parapsilosis]|uniref:RNase MRP protein 1 RNA binding domain-containing protein n=2 Tax=Candida parapsilosis TaxID=5480 RepID=G8BFJ5_CANPC|nr:uncharacterized protein CPAR2_202720 [Candida parapsilosis]KAF6055221.1 hypothetical protein FOB58_001143 [Candida parapsilosis]KAF6055756.1 hypothetical protein FOB59_000268 [Candida parapsilosis]KAF6058686.1 hypothetical protein FOB60_000268 [Candida parapsilosis]KAF6067443.1 hypothetical protein FOB61_000268 [Candida parapsilosis]KAI5901353.1 hypothetical protein K4G60_g489 [Candida parapsilosis]
MDHQTYTSLLNEYDILNLLHHRSKNQHRQQHWFKYVNIIYRNLRNLLKLQIDIDRLPNTATTTTTSSSSSSSSSTKQQSRIEYKKSQIVKLGNKILQVSRSAYWAYNSILVLGQYITLGFALIGNLAKIVTLIGKVDGVDMKRASLSVPVGDSADVNLDNLSNLFQGEVINEDDLDDLGEEIVYDDDDDEVGVSTPVIEEIASSLGREDGTKSSTIDNIKPLPETISGTTKIATHQPSKSTSKKQSTPLDTIDDIFDTSSKKKKRKQDGSKTAKPSKKHKSKSPSNSNSNSKLKSKSKSAIDDIFS